MFIGDEYDPVEFLPIPVGISKIFFLGDAFANNRGLRVIFSEIS